MTLKKAHERALSDLRDIVSVAGGSVEATLSPIGGVTTCADGPGRVPTVLVTLGTKARRVQRPTFAGCAEVLSAWVLDECDRQERRAS